MDFISIILTITTLVIGIRMYYKWAFNYWKNKGVPIETPTIPFGTMKTSILQTENFGEQLQNSYHFAKTSGYKHLGLYSFWKPMYMPVDVQIIKNILGKDFNYFMNRGVYYNEKHDPIGAHLFAIEGTKWKNLRAKLTPTFTSGKMKMMFPTLVQCAENLSHAVNDLSLIDDKLEMGDILGRYTTDVIGSCAFGLECDSFKNPNSDFIKYGKKAFQTTLSESIQTFLALGNDDVARYFGVRSVPKDVGDFFMNVTKETVAYREKNNVKRNDFLHLLIELKNDSSDCGGASKVMKGLTIEEIAAQLFLFFIAGYETSSTTMTFCIYELSSNIEIQEKVREEIYAVLENHDDGITYEAIANLKYLEQVIDETLRKYPPLPILARDCAADYTISETNTVIEKDMTVFIPILGLHYDSDYFPEPEKFDPERFSEENRSKIKPFTYLPFGDGPRNCIGLRFGKMQVKVGLAILLKNFKFVINEKTEEPLKYDPANITLSVLNGIWVNVSKV